LSLEKSLKIKRKKMYSPVSNLAERANKSKANHKIYDNPGLTDN